MKRKRKNKIKCLKRGGIATATRSYNGRNWHQGREEGTELRRCCCCEKGSVEKEGRQATMEGRRTGEDVEEKGRRGGETRDRASACLLSL